MHYPRSLTRASVAVDQCLGQRKIPALSLPGRIARSLFPSQRAEQGAPAATRRGRVSCHLASTDHIPLALTE